MSDTFIGATHPEDGREWECQCARCGSSLMRVQCDQCGGDGLDGHDCGEDCCCCLHPEDNQTCGMCRGEGGWWQCASSGKWCEDHPLPERGEIKGSTPEWYVINGPAYGATP